MLYVKSCEFNIDTNMVEMDTVDNVKIFVDCDRVEDEYGITVRHRANLDYLLQLPGLLCNPAAQRTEEILP